MPRYSALLLCWNNRSWATIVGYKWATIAALPATPLFIRVFLVFFSKLLYYRQFTYIPLHIGCFPRRFLLQPTISQIPLPLGNSPTSGSPGWHAIYTSKSSAKQVAAILGTQKRRRLTKPKLRLVLPQVARVIILCFPSGRRGRAWVRGWGIAGFGDEIGIDWDRSVG